MGAQGGPVEGGENPHRQGAAGGGPCRRILSIDGGGIMGTFPAAFLTALEEDVGAPIGRFFDLICGTSTGGIIAIGLALGMSARELLDLYERRGPEIFGAANKLEATLGGVVRTLRHAVAPKHNSRRLCEVLGEVLGERRIGEALHRLVVPAWEPDSQSVYLFKTAHHLRLKTDYKRKALDAAMGTAAAPTFLRRHRTQDGVGLLDGGVWANNPTALAVVEAIGLLKWPAEDVRVLSLGCVNEIYSLPEAPGVGGVLFELARLFMSGQSHGALGMAKLLLGHEYERDALFRVCPDVPKNLFKLDDTGKIVRLKGLGYSRAREWHPRLGPIFFTEAAAPFTPIYSL